MRGNGNRRGFAEEDGFGAGGVGDGGLALEVAVFGEEDVGHVEGGGVPGVVGVGMIVEEAVLLAFGVIKFDGNFEFAGLLEVGFGLGVVGVFGAVEHDHGREAGLDVFEGGPGVGDVGGGVVEEEEVGFGVGFVGEVHGASSAGGTATGGDAGRVDAVGGGVGAEPFEGGFAVGEAFDGGGFVFVFDAVFGGGGDHAAVGEVCGFGEELLGGTVDEAAAEEEEGGGAVIGGFPIGGVEEGEFEFALWGGGEDEFLAGDGEGGEGE